MATTTNYGWTTPDNSGLVKNGAQDIRNLGQSIDTFLFRPFSSNFIYNSNYDIWQRGTSFAASGFGADRWYNFLSNVTVSRQSSGAPAGSTYYSRDTATGASAYCSHYQYLETADVEQLQGKTVTLSIKMRRNSTNTSGQTLVIQKSATVDAGSGATWTTISGVTIANATIPTGTTLADWYTASLSTTIPSDGTANSIRIYTEYTAAVPNGSIQEFSQAMLQVGSTATPYQRMSGTLAGELAACQRYYYQRSSLPGGAYSVSAGRIFSVHPVTMRVNPTITYPASLTNALEAVGIGNATPTALSTAEAGTNYLHFNATGATGLVLGVPLRYQGNEILFSAEL